MKEFESGCLEMFTLMCVCVFLIVIILKMYSQVSKSHILCSIAAQTTDTGRYIDCVKQVPHAFSLAWKMTSLEVTD